MTDKFNLNDYVTVAERIAAFHTRHPEGSLQSEIVTMTDKLVVVKAYAYRTPDDQRPGIGYSSLEIPGKTPYTRGSELENAESSAWGRAIAALGFEVKRGIATQNEIDSKTERIPNAPPPAPPPSGRPPVPTAGGALTDAQYDLVLTAGRTAKNTMPDQYTAFELWLAAEFGGWAEFVKHGAARVDDAIKILTTPTLMAKPEPEPALHSPRSPR